MTNKNWETTADKVIELGMRYIGVDYQIGADYKHDGSMKFDCSSFVEQAFEAQGFTMWGASRTQFLYDGNKQLKRSELRKGDLAFFTTEHNYEKYEEGDYRRNAHVGIVKKVHSDGRIEVLHTYKKGIGVTVSIMDAKKENYWSRAFLYGKRVIADDGSEAKDVEMKKKGLLERV